MREFTFEEAEKLIDKNIELFPSKNVHPDEAEIRASQFEAYKVMLSKVIRLMQDDYGEVYSVERTVFREKINNAPGSTITAKKTEAEADLDYQKIREIMEKIDSKIKYIKSAKESFHDMHIFYRQLARGE